MQAVIFDVDGVLVATPHERAWREALEELMATDWRAIFPRTAYAAHRFTTMVYQEHVAGKPRESGARAILEFFEVPDPREHAIVYAQRKQQHIDRFIDEGAFEAYPDALRFVIGLSERGIRLGVASSSRNADRFMDRVRLDASVTQQPPGSPKTGPHTLRDVFLANVCGRDIPRGKPAPDIFVLAAHELRVAASSGVVVVEDATVGVQAAKRGGMRALGVARLHDEVLLLAAGADLVVGSLDEVDLDRLQHGFLERRPPCMQASTSTERRRS